ncbi:MAG: hypothetical protein WA863_07565, partial [Methyloceanibacter sp.]
LHGVPEKWPSGTYDYFWIAEYGNQGSDVPTRFSMVKQSSARLMTSFLPTIGINRMNWNLRVAVTLKAHKNEQRSRPSLKTDDLK